ncbi:hypothetical protein V0M98_33835 (plasmid) [Pseudomonas silesiensis]|uniref:hypothetical protein n=1 Tax=Pseudomonas silesiensis TaxID=1853130 RepID=UPI0030D20B46
MTIIDNIVTSNPSEVKEELIVALDNYGKVIHEFADEQAFIAFCDSDGLLAKENGHEAYPEAVLLKAYHELLVEVLTYDAVLGHYRRLLEANPGKALHIGQEDYAVLDDKGYLYCVNKSSSVAFSDAGEYDFDRSAYNTCAGGWNADTYVETWKFIEAPVFLDFNQ